MPAYPWMFKVTTHVEEGDKVVNVPTEFLRGQEGTVVATREALQLVAYLQSLQQAPLPDGTVTPAFLYKSQAPAATAQTTTTDAAPAEAVVDGAAIYAANCQACHQATGTGLKGAFPPLKGSAIVQNDNPEVLIDIILQGYNAREEYGEMPAIGTINHLKPEEITAIINHERTSWGNSAREVSVAEVKDIIAMLESKKNNP
uniref:c-type cytochrome n=1 Tax=Parachryseolinea silvisoli TaxID=2873601 RepID=UPI0037C5FB86